MREREREKRIVHPIRRISPEKYYILGYHNASYDNFERDIPADYNFDLVFLLCIYHFPDSPGKQWKRGNVSDNQYN